MDDDYTIRIQRAELYLLVEFDKVCRQNDLTYFVDSGTALGAVRHGGFIPWDDDIDVGMPRKDYERFMEIGQSLLPPNIFLQNRNTEKNYKRYAAKLRLCGTVFQENNEHQYEHNGFFIDIFPFDNLPSNRTLARWNVKLVVEMLHIVRSYRVAEESSSPSRIRRLVYEFVNKIPQRWIDRIETFCLSSARRYEDVITKYVTCYFWRMSQTKQYLFETCKMFPVKNFVFEGKNVRIMHDPDYYLTIMYGQYQNLPPVNMRVSHHSGFVDFGDFVD